MFLLRTSNSAGPPQRTFTYGNPQLRDVPLVGDFNGDGVDTIAIVRPDRTGHILWLVRNELSSGSPDKQFVYGNWNTDVPLVGDWNGDGIDTIGVARPNSSGDINWLLRDSNSGGAPDEMFTFGSTNGYTVVPVGDWNGVAADGVGVGTISLDDADHWTWDLTDSHMSFGVQTVSEFTYGGSRNRDAPIVGDWDGDGGQSAGVARVASNGYWWWLLRNENSSGTPDVPVFSYGNALTRDLPLVGNWVGPTNPAQTPGVARPVVG
jgi:hypothetical protein